MKLLSNDINLLAQSSTSRHPQKKSFQSIPLSKQSRCWISTTGRRQQWRKVWSSMRNCNGCALWSELATGGKLMTSQSVKCGETKIRSKSDSPLDGAETTWRRLCSLARFLSSSGSLSTAHLDREHAGKLKSHKMRIFLNLTAMPSSVLYSAFVSVALAHGALCTHMTITCFKPLPVATPQTLNALLAVVSDVTYRQNNCSLVRIIMPPSLPILTSKKDVYPETEKVWVLQKMMA